MPLLAMLRGVLRSRRPCTSRCLRYALNSRYCNGLNRAGSASRALTVALGLAVTLVERLADGARDCQAGHGRRMAP
jgi:hypothetical protein